MFIANVSEWVIYFWCLNDLPFRSILFHPIIVSHLAFQDPLKDDFFVAPISKKEFPNRLRHFVNLISDVRATTTTIATQQRH